MWFDYVFFCDDCIYVNNFMSQNGAIRETKCKRCHSSMNINNMCGCISVYEDENKEKLMYYIDPHDNNKFIYPTPENSRSYFEKQENKVTCPYCHSTDCTKIGQISRTVSTGFFGLGSSKVGKQWHCNTCKSDF